MEEVRAKTSWISLQACTRKSWTAARWRDIWFRCETFYKFAMIEELVTVDPTENLESPKSRQSLPTYLRVDEVDRFWRRPT